MRRKTNEKNLTWSSKDIAGVTTVFVCNALLIFGLLIISAYLNCYTSGLNFIEFISNYRVPLHFLVLMTFTVTALFMYFMFEDRNFLKNPINCQMIFLILEVGLIMSFALGKYVNPLLRPLALPALLMMFLTNKKNAVFVETIFCMLVLLVDSFSGTVLYMQGYSVLVFGFVSGIVAIFGMGKVFSRLRLLVRSLLISIPTFACGIMLVFASDVSLEPIATLFSAAFAGPVSVAAVLILLPLFEAIFKKVSSFKYAELTDHKTKLLRRLIKEAPGTFNHSIVVSNIAEACATAIGEDAMLARTCAYYHDIGKLRRPEFFKENQAESHNPHDDLTPELSTNIIKSHAIDGYSLILKNRLPKEIADVCLEHHGTLPILYFYDKAQKLTDGDVDLNQFCYQGPKPQSKIAAIIMIADGCEAAARSIKDRSRENVQSVVRKIVDDRMKLGQFDECEITMKELNIIIHTVVNNLTGIYHNRIEYPKISLTGIE